MMTALKKLASLKLTLVGLVALIVNSVAITQWPATALSWLVLPLGLLAVNLAAAVAVRHAFRHQAALLLFHVGLLAIVVIAGASVLLRFDGRVEIVEGAPFTAEAVVVSNAGWLHRNRLEAVRFTQGPLTVRYIDGLQRGTTESRVAVTDTDGTSSTISVGDRHGFELEGYRFMTTPNKGFALLVEWWDGTGVALGTIHFPSFPEFEWKQLNTWTTPAGEELALELVLGEPVPNQGPWQLASPGTAYSLRVRTAGGDEYELLPGETQPVAGGRIRVADLRLWMGYRIDHEPLLPWLLAAAFLTLIAMAAHFVGKYARATAETPAPILGEEQPV